MEEKSQHSRFELLAKIAVLVFGVTYSLLFFILSISRLLYPYELELSEGTVLEHALRILQHKPLFTAPTISFVNLQYQPLYYYAAAGAMHFFGVNYFSGRLVSFSSALLCAVLIFYMVYKNTRSLGFSFVGLWLFLAAYGVTGRWYELARVDTLMLLFLAGSIALLLSWKNRVMVVLSALVLVLSFYTKQELVFYFAAGVLWLFLQDKRRAILFATSSIVFLVLGFYLFTLDSGRWYYYFTFALPAASAGHLLWYRMWGGLAGFLFTYYSAGTLLLLSLGIFAWKRRNLTWRSPTGLILLFVMTAILQLAIQSAHSGSNKNIAMPLSLVMAIAIPMVSYHLWNCQDARLRAFVLMAILIQFGGLFYSFRSVPLAMITKKDYAAGAALEAEIENIPGTVFFPQHCFLSRMAGKQTFANIDAIEDCEDANDSTARRLRDELQHAFSTQRFDAIILDDAPYRPFDSIPGYTLAGEINRGPHPFITKVGEALYVPRYVFYRKNE